MTTDLNTLLTGLYVKIDEYLGRPVRPGRPPKLTDAELLTLAVAQVLLGVRSEARWLRFVPRHLPGAFPYLPGQSGYNKRLRAAVPLIKRLIRVLAADTDLWSDPVWIVDSTPLECARSRPAARRSNLAGRTVRAVASAALPRPAAQLRDVARVGRRADQRRQPAHGSRTDRHDPQPVHARRSGLRGHTGARGVLRTGC